MRVVTLDNGSLGVDTVTPITSSVAAQLCIEGFKFVGRYITSLTQFELATILSTDLALTLFSYANSFDPSDEIASLKRLQIPHDVVVWLDTEGVHDDAVTLQARINTWSRALKSAGYIPGIYVGAQSILTSKELYDLATVRYCKSCSRCLDRNGAVQEPNCGYCLNQVACQQQRAGITVDVDVTYADYTGRKVAMVAA